MAQDDRRRAERIRLGEPLQARLGHIRAQLIEVGLVGALIEHDEPLNPGAQAPLTFAWGGEIVTLECVVARCDLQQRLTQTRGTSVYQSGLEIQRARSESALILKRMIAAHVSRALEEQKANARGELASWVQQVPFLSSASIAKSKQNAPAKKDVYISCRLDRGQWRREIVYKPKQPLDGFTVSGTTSESELDLLCTSYQQADEAARKLIRVCAEMSITSDDPVPPPRYQP